MTRYSFIIPTMNEEKYIEDCLKSITRLKGEKEIIIVDSSKDNTFKIAKKYGKVIKDDRRGPGAARNKGAKIAKGEVLVFTDADVRFDEDFLEMLKKRFDKGISGCVFNLNLFDSEKTYERILFSLANYSCRMMIGIGRTITNGSCFAYSRDVFEKVNGFSERMETNEDHELADKASNIRRFVFCPEIKIYTSNRRMKNLGLFNIMKFYVKSTLTFFVNKKGISIENYWS